MKPSLLTLFLIFILFGCSGKVPDALRPANRIFGHMPTGGSPEYEQGWKEGCESGLSGMTNSFYRSFYILKQDNSLITNEVYYKAWKDSYDYCKGYAYGIVKEGNMRRSLPHARRHFFPEAKGDNVLGNTLGGEKASSGVIGWFDNMGPGLIRW